ncbi:universal stress protein UspE [Rheinheimera aquimaris]|jgi:universal stress protein E|uniref:Universal stress protein UspE n=1 Tax=Rheinheimera aquimaris TaxID=412437 RepID=A0ABN1DB55_9GAMM|nr:universal stress protein [Rheinheimera aquimaris]MCB5212496.1 universal stress protein [Rheinheimera aquimaris]
MHSAFYHLLVIQQQQSNDELALHRAIALAEQYGSRVTVFQSFYKRLQPIHHNSVSADNELAGFIGQFRQDILQRAGRLTAKELQLDVVVSWRESEKHAISQLIEQRDISMVITPQHCKRNLLPLLANSLEHYLISDCELPVWLVKPGQINAEINVLACLDLEDNPGNNSQMNEVILDISGELSHNEQQLHVINCYSAQHCTMSLPYSSQSGFEPLPDIAKQHSDKLQHVTRRCGIPADCLHLQDGLPDDEIPKTVQSLHSQLAIIGNNHMHDISSALLGDTAHYLSQHMPCDVLVIKPTPGFAAAGR